ncbi:hypothetical protein [Streptomyces tauricus]|uniref:hypothetical protein n=1 Tax=Streptomyces tauricus TaxID=68274 RepID=UPI0022436922|nr:hypothetical protein [Streptomyces tauricus]MCW8096520.1 hypothetical protein [Streptomyces tauricus]
MRASATRAWADARRERVSDSDPAHAPVVTAVTEPLAPPPPAVRHQGFPDGVELSERDHHQGDPASASRAAVRRASAPCQGLAGPGRTLAE